VAWPEKRRVGKKEGGWDLVVLDEILGPVEILQEAVEEAGTLNQAGLNLLPFLMGDHHGNEIQGPRPSHALCIGVNRVGGPVFPQDAAGPLPAGAEILRSEALQCVKEWRPVGAGSSSLLEQFVKSPRNWNITFQ
jgi:hypothetical protein